MYDDTTKIKKRKETKTFLKIFVYKNLIK